MKPSVSSPSPRVADRRIRFYESDRSLARIVAEFLSEGLHAGHPAIVIAGGLQRATILRELKHRLVDVLRLQRSDALLLLDGDHTLSTFMVDGQPDPDKFSDTMRRAIDRVSEGRTGCTVRMFGELVDLLWRRRERDAAVRLEVLWNQLAATATFSLRCGYVMGHFYKAQ